MWRSKIRAAALFYETAAGFFEAGGVDTRLGCGRGFLEARGGGFRGFEEAAPFGELFLL